MEMTKPIQTRTKQDPYFIVWFGFGWVWSFNRYTGLWPLSLFSAENSILRLLHCPGCGCPNPSIDHALKFCPRTAHFLTDSGLDNFVSRMVSPETFYGVLFHSCIEPSIEVARIRYVGSVIQFICLEYCIWHKCSTTSKSCCCQKHCGLCPCLFNFRLITFFLYIYIYTSVCVATTCWCVQGYRATHLPLACPVGAKRLFCEP